jgi:mevalonate kinase
VETEVSRITDQPAFEYLEQTSQWIASAPGVFFWAGEHSVLVHGFAVCQQIPRRVYVGLEPIGASNDLQLEIAGGDDGSGLFYDRDSRNFVPMQFPRGEWSFASFVPDLLISERTKERIQELATHLGLRGRFRLRVLSEFRPGAGLAWSGAFAAALTGALFAAAGRLPDNRWSFPWKDDLLLAEINAWAWELERWLQGGSASGYGTLCAMVECTVPQLYTLQPKDPQQSVASGLHSPGRLVEALTAATTPVTDESALVNCLPLDFCIVYTGVGKSTAASISRVSSSLPTILDSAIEAVRSVPAALPWVDGGDHIEGESNIKGVALHRILIDGVHTSTLRVLGELVRAFRASPDDSMLESLAAAVDAVAGGLSQIGLDWPHAELVRAAIIRSAWPNASQIGIKPTGGGHGGSVFFLYPRMTWRNDGELADVNSLGGRLLRELESLKVILGRSVSLDWCSSRDGFEGGGLQLSSKRMP